MMKKVQYNTAYIVRIAFISALGGYLFGFDFAVIAGALPFLKIQFGFDEVQEGFATASLALGCMLGCIIAGSISDRFGRKKGLLLAASIFFISSLCMTFSNSSALFVFSRFAAGIGVGMASVLSPMYIAEIAPATIRGRMVAINQLTIVIGIFVTNLVNYSLRNVGEDAWRWMVGLGAVPSALFLIGVLWLPESPRWLVKAQMFDRAKAILNKIGYPENEILSTVTQIRNSVNTDTRIDYGAIFRKAVWPAVMVGIVLAVFQQLCGINVVFNYTSSIFESVGFTQDDQLKQTVFIGLVNMIFTLIAMWQVDKLGRKPLMSFGSLGLTVLYVISALLLQSRSATASWTLLAAIGVYAMTLAPVTWVLIAEVFPNKVRAAATSIAVLALWLSYAVLTFTFPILSKNMGTYTPFYIYSVICLLGALFVWIRVKETKGKSLEDMDAVYAGH
ncbi:sugar porter family MFS transporter [Niabella digestorum]|uniref:Sugar porter family MFS transporter n=1 Tax=Niabella digestorum TaxID=3117701 RepID=A0ABU7REV6_9BACT